MRREILCAMAAGALLAACSTYDSGYSNGYYASGYAYPSDVFVLPEPNKQAPAAQPSMPQPKTQPSAGTSQQGATSAQTPAKQSDTNASAAGKKAEIEQQH